MATPEQRLVTEQKLFEATAVRDTGWRDISASLSNGWAGKVMARRIGQIVQLAFRLDGSAATGSSFISLPVPLAPSYPSSTGITHRFTIDPVIGGDDATLGEVVWAGITGTTITVEEIPRSTSAMGSTVYMTNQAWTTSFPGVGL